MIMLLNLGLSIIYLICEESVMAGRPSIVRFDRASHLCYFTNVTIHNSESIACCYKSNAYRDERKEAQTKKQIKKRIM